MSSKTHFRPHVARGYMKAQGRKVGWLADECKCTREHMSLVLHGHRPPSDGLVEKMATALNLEADAFGKVGPRAKAS